MIRFVFYRILAPALLASALPSTLLAQGDTPNLDSGDTAWMLTATVLVLFMSLPGLALFYGGLVRVQNVLSVLMHCFTIACIASVLWVLGLYSLAFSGDGDWIGNLEHIGLKGILADELNGGTIPETVFVMFQMTFAIITPGLIVGAFVERLKFSAMMLFTALWLIVVYTPVAHWVWGGGWMMVCLISLVVSWFTRQQASLRSSSRSLSGRVRIFPAE